MLGDKRHWDNGERQAFLDAAARFLAPPNTKNGVQPSNMGRHYRVGAFIPRIKLGIDAMEDAMLRVHLFADESGGEKELRSLAAPPQDARLSLTRGLPAPIFRWGSDEPERLYFGFNWDTTDRGEADLSCVQAAIEWLVSLRSVRPTSRSRRSR
jgi:hypothetical protein